MTRVRQTAVRTISLTGILLSLGLILYSFSSVYHFPGSLESQNTKTQLPREFLLERNHKQSSGNVSLPMLVKLRNYIPNAFIYPNGTTLNRGPILAFLHNPKSGGLSVRDCMLRIYKKTNKDHPIVVAFNTISEVQENLLNNITRPNDYYMGDSVMGLGDYITDRSVSYFTMMRDPYDRAISHYFFCRSGRGGQVPSCNTTLEKYTLSQCSLFFRQMTTRMFCNLKNETQNGNQTWKCNAFPRGVDDVRRNPEKRELILNYFLQNLDQIFTVIGLTEEFERSLLMFERAFGDPFHNRCHNHHSNSGSYLEGASPDEKGQKEKIHKKYKLQLKANGAIRECLHEDIKLYEKATEIFQIQAQNL